MIRRPPRSTLFPYTNALPISHDLQLEFLPADDGLFNKHRVYRTQIEAALNDTLEFFAVECYRSEEHTSELQSRLHLVCRLLLEKKKIHTTSHSLTHTQCKISQ